MSTFLNSNVHVVCLHWINHTMSNAASVLILQAHKHLFTILANHIAPHLHVCVHTWSNTQMHNLHYGKKKKHVQFWNLFFRDSTSTSPWIVSFLEHVKKIYIVEQDNVLLYTILHMCSATKIGLRWACPKAQRQLIGWILLLITLSLWRRRWFSLPYLI